MGLFRFPTLIARGWKFNPNLNERRAFSLDSYTNRRLRLESDSFERKSRGEATAVILAG